MAYFKAKVIRGDALWHANLPKPEPLLVNDTGFPVFTRPSIIEIVAGTGVGKSMFALGMSLAIATGTQFLMWKAPIKRRVLYIDGEMIGDDDKDRLIKMGTAIGFSSKDCTNIAYIARDWQDDQYLPLLDTTEGQVMMVQFLQDEPWDDHDYAEEEEVINQAHLESLIPYIQAWNPEVIVFDNAVTLFNPAGEQDLESWKPARDFLMRLRNKRITSILIHHAGKDDSKGARGHSSRNDTLDTIIHLSLPEDYHKSQGTRFNFKWSKGRKVYGDAAVEFEARFDEVKGWEYNILDDEAEDPTDPNLTKLENKVNSYITSNPGEVKSDICKALHIDSHKLQKALDTLFDNGYVELRGGGWGIWPKS